MEGVVEAEDGLGYLRRAADGAGDRRDPVSRLSVYPWDISAHEALV